MSTKAKLQTTIENAISKADASYFFEDYTKQAKAVIAALDAKGFVVMAKDLPEVMKLHSDFVQGQMRALAEQFEAKRAHLRAVATGCSDR